MNIIRTEKLEKCFTINDELEIKKLSNNIAYIDNFFKNFDLYEELYDKMYFTTFNSGEWSSTHFLNKSFVEVQAVLHIKTLFLFQFKMQQIINQVFNFKTQTTDRIFFNGIKWKKKVNQKCFGDYPHQDGDCFSMVTYLTDGGGVHIFDDKRGFFSNENRYANNSDFLTQDAIDNFFHIKHKIDSIKNRVVLLYGNDMHGAHFTENEFVDTYRKYTTILFNRF